MDTFSESSDIGILMRDVALEFNQRTMGASPSHEVTVGQDSISLAAEMLLGCVVADAASTLSQGQKQLLCVARILLGEPRFVFLDEASSSLDPSSELLMYTALKTHLPSDTTVLAVSHRYDREGIRSLCSQVLELDHGRLTKYEDIFFL
jgi:ABC-type transport system involved in cytochrome bd biosynthesis fused ATPase/permease subunit